MEDVDTAAIATCVTTWADDTLPTLINGMSVSRGTRAANDPPDVVIGSELERLRRNWRVIAVIAAAALGVLALQAFLHGHFSAVDEYDDGVYFGASLELSHGVLAYRDFAFIQPPMITVWMLPFAGLSSLTGTAVAMEAGRFFVDLVSVTNVVLVGALVRRRSTLHVIVVTGITAFSQGTIRSSQTILIEPFLVLACLTALLFLMHGDAVTLSSRRVGWSGACFGVAGATKVWAIFPLVAALIIMSTVKKGGRRTLVGGALIGFFACSLPFIVGAPVAFFHEVLVTQATRNAGGLALPERMADLTGIPGFSSLTEQHRVLGLGLLALLLLIGSLALLVCRNVRERLRWSPLERFSLWSTLLVGAALLLSPTYYYHYSGFMAPFLALVVGTVIAKLRDPLETCSRSDRSSSGPWSNWSPYRLSLPSCWRPSSPRYSTFLSHRMSATR